jgi:hypothetical protein
MKFHVEIVFYQVLLQELSYGMKLELSGKAQKTADSIDPTKNTFLRQQRITR